MQRIQIVPGMMLTAVRTEKFKTASLSFQFLRPLCREEASRNALLSNVLLRGTQKHPDLRSVSAVLENLYGANLGALCRKKGEIQTVGIYAEFLDDRFAFGESVTDEIIGFLAEIFREPKCSGGAFDAEIVRQEKENLLNSIRGRVNSKRAYATYQTIRAMFSEEAYGVDGLGEEEDVEAITPQVLFEHFNEVLACSKAEICYVGSLDAPVVARILRRAFAFLPRKEPFCEVGTSVRLAATSVQELSECMDVTQGKLCMGFRTGCTVTDPDWDAMRVFCTVYGSGVTSKLFVNVREKQSICYYAGASLEKFKGFMLVSSGIDFDQYERAKHAILNEWQACCRGEVSDAELYAAKTQMLSALRTVSDSQSQLDEQYLSDALSGLWRTREEIEQSIRAVEAQQVADAARRLTLDTVFFLKGVDA